MITILWGAKGGAGTTFVATQLARASTRRALLVDLDGDAARMLGVDQRERPGVRDWLTSEAPTAHLADVLIDVPPATVLLPAATAGAPKCAWRTRPIERARWQELAAWCREWGERPDHEVVVDAGTGEPPAEMVDVADRRLVVIRRCYLAATRVSELRAVASGIVIVDERGRTLGTDDIANAIGAPIVATIPYDERVARAIDSGLLLTRLPRRADCSALAEAR